MISKIIDNYVESNALSLPSHSMHQVAASTQNLIKDNKLKITKTKECPTLIPFKWYLGELSLEGKAINSSGEGFSKKTAQIRCVGEIFERIPLFIKNCAYHKLIEGQLIPGNNYELTSSNGLSYALCAQDGVYNSYRELVEREVIMDYWFNKKTCWKIKGLGKWNLLHWASGSKNKLKANFYCLPNSHGLFVICAHLHCPKRIPYNIYGYGCHETLDKALEKAFLEAWRFYWEFGRTKNKGLGKEIKSFLDHFYYHAFTNDDPPSYFPQGSMSPDDIIKNQHPLQDFKIDDLYIFNLEKYGIPGYCTKVIRNDFNNIMWGALTKKTGEREHGEVHPIP